MCALRPQSVHENDILHHSLVILIFPIERDPPTIGMKLVLTSLMDSVKLINIRKYSMYTSNRTNVMDIFLNGTYIDNLS